MVKIGVHLRTLSQQN